MIFLPWKEKGALVLAFCLCMLGGLCSSAFIKMREDEMDKSGFFHK